MKDSISPPKLFFSCCVVVCVGNSSIRRRPIINRRFFFAHFEIYTVQGINLNICPATVLLTALVLRNNYYVVEICAVYIVEIIDICALYMVINSVSSAHEDS